MKKFEAVIFDMDGVIIDSEPRHERAFLEVFETIGYARNHGIEFHHYYGRSDRALWLDFVERHQPPFALDDLIRWKNERFLDLIRRDEPIFAPLPGLLQDLAPCYQLAVASGSYHPVIEVVLGMKGLRRFFPVVVSVQDVPRGKPAPDVFLRAAELLGVSPGNCCVVEDAATGVAGARAAGMEVIAITNSLPAASLAQASHVVETYAQLAALLLPPP
jgi:beta-phosphoglucomutase-like phosphatase (HAD superfamily)